MHFLKRHRSKQKRALNPGEMYCFKCRTPKFPALGMADFVPTSRRLGNLRGLCPTCGTFMHRTASLATLTRAKGELDVRFLGGSIAPSRED